MVAVISQMNYNKSCDGSSIVISSEQIVAMANQSLKNIRLAKKQDLQYVIDKEKLRFEENEERKAKSWWGRLFGYTKKATPSDSQALQMHIDDYADCINPDETFWINLRYQKNKDAAYRLLNASKYAKELTVSTRDLDLLL